MRVQIKMWKTYWSECTTASQINTNIEILVWNYVERDLVQSIVKGDNIIIWDSYGGGATSLFICL